MFVVPAPKLPHVSHGDAVLLGQGGMGVRAGLNGCDIFSSQLSWPRAAFICVGNVSASRNPLKVVYVVVRSIAILMVNLAIGTARRWAKELSRDDTMHSFPVAPAERDRWVASRVRTGPRGKQANASHAPHVADFIARRVWYRTPLFTVNVFQRSELVPHMTSVSQMHIVGKAISD